MKKESNLAYIPYRRSNGGTVRLLIKVSNLERRRGSIFVREDATPLFKAGAGKVCPRLFSIQR
jgi:hypothetical protein